MRWHFDPVYATQCGNADADGRLGSFDDESVREHIAACRSSAAALEQLDVSSLDEEVDRTALLNDIRVRVHVLEKERPQRKNPGYWLSHLFEGLYRLLIRTGGNRERTIRDVRARLESVPRFLETAGQSLADCPEVFIETAAGVCDGGRELIAETGRVFGNGDERFEAVVSEAVAALESFKHGLGRLRAGETADGYAIGGDAFNYRLRYEHALGSSSRELLEFGRDLLERTEYEIKELARKIDRTREWPDVVEALRENHPGRHELLDAYQKEMNRAREHVEARKLCAVPEGDLRVVETPAFLRPLVPYAAYEAPGVFTEDCTGYFYVTLPDDSAGGSELDSLLRDHCIHEIPATSLHEGYPGHHLQLLTARCQDRLVRKIVESAVTIEGWALYCEDMMGEVGFYRTPEERLFQKMQLLWRAVRVIVDIGLHTAGMAREDAVNLLVERAHLERANAEAEVRRYCSYPVYQLSYAVGYREITNLRERFSRSRNSDCLREFHDAVLSYGSLPPSLIAWGLGV